MRNPDDTEVYNNSGMVYFCKGNYIPAIADFNKIIELETFNANAYNYLVIAYLAHGLVYYDRDNNDRVSADFSKATELEINESLVYHNLGRVYSAKRDYNRAIENYHIAEFLQIP